MSELVPAAFPTSSPSLLAPLTDPAGGSPLTRLRSFAAQGPVRKMLPVFLGVAALGAVGLTYATLAPAPQRVLYSELNDNERAGVLRHLIAEGQLSGYGLVNAVTHYSQEVEDYDRATEFEALGGRLIDLPAHEWKGLAEAA